MAKTIQQTAQFSVKPAKLYNLYADSKEHTASTSGKASVGTKPGGSFSAHGGQIKGKMLHLAKNKMIVQTWRSVNFKKTDSDSILTMIFEETPKGGQVRLIHANVPDQDFKGVTQGWRNFYWNRWKAYLEKPAAKKATAKKAVKKTPARRTAAKKTAAGKAPARGG